MKQKRCDGEFDNEKHKKPKYKCLECASVFCGACASHTGYLCMFCEPPTLTEIR